MVINMTKLFWKGFKKHLYLPMNILSSSSRISLSFLLCVITNSESVSVTFLRSFFIQSNTFFWSFYSNFTQWYITKLTHPTLNCDECCKSPWARGKYVKNPFCRTSQSSQSNGDALCWHIREMVNDNNKRGYEILFLFEK